MRRLALPLVVALLALGCKEANPDYCPDADPKFMKSCAKYRASLDAHVEGPEAGDAADAGDASEAGDAADAGDASEAGDAMTDAVEAPAEKKPFCTVDGGECAAMADGGALLACDTSGAAPTCVECVDSSNCTATGKTVCDTKAHRCVECLDDTKCGAAKPVCDTKTNVCRICGADAECKTAPGVCVDWDGHCAVPSEVLTLQGGAGCVAVGLNYCKSSAVSAAISPTTPILVVQGPDPVGMIEPSLGLASKVLIVGKPGASVGAGTGDVAGIHLGGAGVEYWVRDIAVSGGTVGIFVESAKLAHISRCVVTGNGKGGLRTSSSGFDITNTIIANNMAGADDIGAGFGGVRLGDLPVGGGLARFQNNTVVDNKLVGVSCKVATYDISTSILHNNVGGNVINCAGTMCCGPTDPDPLLDPSYHLKVGSPCIDKIDATATTLTTDIQGQPRPTLPPGGKLDCGADEYVP
jgi:hypothetical protein